MCVVLTLHLVILLTARLTALLRAVVVDRLVREVDLREEGLIVLQLVGLEATPGVIPARWLAG
jgi:hypothetical protein